MVLTDLFNRSNRRFAIAHCNFQLRGTESNKDAEFVSAKAAELDVKFYVKSFETQHYAINHRLSIQEAARVLRYYWLEHIRARYKYDYLVTAHHLDDSLETFLFNFSKGTGLKGLIGIPPVNGKIIRPLLGFGRSELEIYYQHYKLEHREDASNSKEDYDRNKIRHQIVPVLKAINPGLCSNVATNFENLKDTFLLFQERVQQLKEEMVSQAGTQTKIKLPALMLHPARSTLLYEFLNPFHFHPNQISQILDCINRQGTGAIFYSKYYRLLIDRDQLIIEVSKDVELVSYKIKGPNQTLELSEEKLILQEVQAPGHFPDDLSIAFLNLEKLQFPLQLRRGQKGDQCCPLGMNGKRKKVQDLLSDLKINRFAKDQIWILENGNGEICWVLGLRLDERYKIVSTTGPCLQLI